VGSLTLSLIAFACIFGGTFAGMALRDRLPEHHLSDESKDAVKLGTGMVATLAALVLGLLIASAKGTFDTMTNELKLTGSKIVLLDRAMAQYGPETGEAREHLHLGLALAIQRIWPEDSHEIEIKTAQRPGNQIEALQDKLLQLSPRNDAQKWLRSRALQINTDISEERTLLFAQVGKSSIPGPFLVVLVCWLAIIFTTFGLFSPRNGTVMIVMIICALSAAAALYLILELDQPYGGLIKISNAPLRDALAVIGK
jgi:hypothetical protein